MTNRSHIAVLITVHNRRETTLDCLKQLVQQPLHAGTEMQVYLTDDGSTDGTTEAVRQAFPEVTIVAGDGNLYWNRGMLRAWEKAASERDYDYYLWLNDDTMLLPGTIKRLLEESQELEGQCIVVGATTDSQRSGRLTYGGRIEGKVPPCEGKRTKVDTINGNIVLIPAAVYRRLGMLDPILHHALGDYDYGWRAKKAGIEMYQCGTIVGQCDTHDKVERWCNPQVPLHERWQAMMRPNGMPPSLIFYITKKHHGILKALYSTMAVVTRCLLARYLQK